MPNPQSNARAREMLFAADRPSLSDVLWSEGHAPLESGADPAASLLLLEAWEMAVVLADGGGEIVYANPAATQLLGHEAVDLAYHAPLASWRWTHEARQDVAPGSLCGIGEVWRGTASITDATEREIVADCAVYPLCDAAGDVVCLAAVLRDRTAQEHQASLGAMNAIAGRLAHDLNNLLTVQVAYSQMLVEELDQDSLAHQEATQVLRSVRRLIELSHKLMLSSGRVLPGPTVVDLGQLLGEMQGTFDELAGDGVELALSVAPGSLRARADGQDIESMVLALVRNGLDAVGVSGSVAVTVRPFTCARAVDGLAPGEYIMIAVSDTGPGLSADMIDHLYEPLYAHQSGGVGTGMGLATARGVALAHGGVIRLADSLPGQGARFEVLLPVESD